MKYLVMSTVFLLTLSNAACGLKGDGDDKATNKTTKSEDATVTGGSEDAIVHKNTPLVKGTLLYTPDGDVVIYKPTTTRECAGVQDCPGVSDTFIQECEARQYRIVTYSCCYKACTGKLK